MALKRDPYLLRGGPTTFAPAEVRPQRRGLRDAAGELRDAQPDAGARHPEPGPPAF